MSPSEPPPSSGRPPGREINWRPDAGRRTGRRGRQAGLAAALVVFAGVIGVVILTGGGDTPEQGAAEATGQWRPMAAAPLSPRIGAANEWTGRELLVWGGRPCADETVESLADGAAYDPAADSWRPMASSPLSARSAQAVWSGREMLVWDGAVDASGAQVFADGAAYDPGPTAGDRWLHRPWPAASTW